MTLCDIPLEGEVLKNRIVETISRLKNPRIWFIAFVTGILVFLIIKDAKGEPPALKPVVPTADEVCPGCTFPEGTKDPIEELLSQIREQEDGCMIPLNEPDPIEELLKKLKNEQK